MNLELMPLLLAANKYRIINYDFPQILGVPAELVIVLSLFVASIVFGTLFARAVRMREYGWRVALILSTALVSSFIVLLGEFKLGVDLKGGVILVYEVNEEATRHLNPQGRFDQWSMGQLIHVIGKRLNPDGLKEIVVRPFGPKQVEIVVPEVDPNEIKLIKDKISTSGVLQFMIVAGETDTDLVELAKSQVPQRGKQKLSADVVDEQGHRVGFWARLDRVEGDPKTAPFRSLDVVHTGYIRDARTGEMIELTPAERNIFGGNNSQFQAFLNQRGTHDIDVLLKYDELFLITGDDLGGVDPDRDEMLRPSISFRMRGEGVYKMGHLTQENLHRKLAIVFDNRLKTAPVIQSKISDRGQITGNFTVEEVNFYVEILRSGSMPVVMQKQPISENEIGSILGRDTIIKGSWSVIVSLGLVLLFMFAYYRFAGLVACFALVLNLLLTVAIMVVLRAPFTLPGLAGLVLTVAMSVDANVLISERMREELARGAALRMAIRNGFDKALSAIIDGNLTTFLTAAVLYFIGTDQVKGFGITLMLGNITSMYTAIFCARVILDIGERTRWLKSLSMGSFLTKPQVDWVPFLMPAAVGSVVLIVVGVIATVARGKGLFDTDLAGGTSVTFILKDSTPEDVVRQKLAGVLDNLKNPATNTGVDHDVYEMSMATAKPHTVYKVDSSLEDKNLLQQKVREALRLPDGQDGLKTYQMQFSALTESLLEKPPVGPSISDPKLGSPGQPPAESTSQPAVKQTDGAQPAEQPAAKPEEKSAEQRKAPDSAQPAEAGAAEKPAREPLQGSGCDDQPVGAPASSAPKDEPAPPADAAAQPGTPAPPTPPGAPSAPRVDGTTAPANTPTAAPVPKVQTKAVVKFPGSAIGGAALRERVVASGIEVINRAVDVEVDNPNWDRNDNSTFEDWTIVLHGVDKEHAQQILDHVKASLESDVVWQTSSQIGGQVSADTRWRAIGALAISLLGIVAYVWFRFQNVAWGLAAVAALAHDALVMLTGIALSYWFAGALGFLGIEEFKISLPVVAAFLTILGYSVNDTIVIFDRLREIRGKSPHVTRQMLNDAVNQTLGRTIILFGITLAVVVILYAFGGSGIHAFAFALVIGVISGCYSTLVIAAPMLLWLLSPKAVQPAAKVEKREMTKSVA